MGFRARAGEAERFVQTRQDDIRKRAGDPAIDARGAGRIAAEVIDLARLAADVAPGAVESLRKLGSELYVRMPQGDPIGVALIRVLDIANSSPRGRVGRPQNVGDAYYRALGGVDESDWAASALDYMARFDRTDIDPMDLLMSAVMIDAQPTARTDHSRIALRRAVEAFARGGTSSDGWIYDATEIRGSLVATYVAAASASIAGMPVRDETIATAVRSEETLAPDRFGPTIKELTSSYVSGRRIRPGSAPLVAIPPGELIASRDAVLMALAAVQAGSEMRLPPESPNAAPPGREFARERVVRWMLSRGSPGTDLDAGRIAALTDLVENVMAFADDRYLALGALATAADVEQSELLRLLRLLDRTLGICGYPRWMVRSSSADGTCDLRATLTATIARSIVHRDVSVLSPRTAAE
ncbi:hypothetical protein P0W64_06265 [Tsukamurella sp. 8F]|uniref:hypothetical protein n=1 Tax=unclassified Tsukamurella TaxID=2633480 RepID=UPI0023B9E04C|nr:MULTISPECIES: hypothetical protein [unclassified Tsukamurella]MDF0530057.1 hypothetical protein [Tsukamurella sp. 8J]MDF0586375.1 hypothetical protein [Tsukamurella sp. 8F]